MEALAYILEKAAQKCPWHIAPPRRRAALRVDTQLNAGGEDQKRASLNADRGEKLVEDISLIDPLFL